MSMLLLLVVTLLVIAAVVGVVSGSIPTPIPMHVANRGRDLSSGPLWLTVWRATLVVGVFAFGLFSIVVNPSGLLAFLIAGLVLWVFMEDLQATLLDIWNGNFWRLEP